ncbi:hypothetical protein [Mycoplasmopsis cynos]|uniref:hypothetical protein n=1 Tax=Mycoplasmopsis cynos TaxID=171284 RepID=UPI0021FF1DD2|nr:hypothetical protein [Mycoplasmopsis cynos]UWV82779.1 hypothetical protein NW067_00370 [Mycoplasmopsis cynos]WAM03633.1 hypothetical protein ONA22_01015 [Mycoplasmopsis cynos]
MKKVKKILNILIGSSSFASFIVSLINVLVLKIMIQAKDLKHQKKIMNLLKLHKKKARIFKQNKIQVVKTII